jgi:NADPH-dependent glutamate synthase beta subunit-like oxidoreductase/coenzyme F420-reducing hydrogenase delta subunit
VSKGALIVGGSVAGLQAALDLADSGIKVHLVEPSPFFGNGLVTGDGGTAAIPRHLLNARLLEVARHANVTTWTNARINRAEGEAGRFRVELRRHPRYVDLANCTACGDCVQVCPVTVPGTDQKAIVLAQDGQPGCAAIAKLGKAPCSNTCPGGIHVQGYVALIAQGRFQEAIDLIRDAIPFPGICGRICTHPCEINCRRSEVDKPVAIRLLKRFVSDWELTGNREQGANDEDPAISQPLNPQKVAVVGAGPGGMAVADRLARMGYGVTVFEKLPVIGGMMAVGIPEYRLPREVIAREYRRIQDLGVEIRLNTAIGPSGDHTLDDLFDMGFEAICLAVGAHRSHALRIPGEELPGVAHGIDLLRTISLSQRLDDAQHKAALAAALRRGTKTRVAILGGGNTAMDVSRSLRRFGVEDVRILYRRTRAEMPAAEEEIEDAEQEGVVVEYLVAPVRVLGDEETGVVGLECQRMKLGEADASGRRRPVPIADSEFVVDLDLVVLAIGQAPDLACLGQDHGIAITRDERINVGGISFMTSRSGVFAAGDAVTRDKMAVIEAIGMGKRTAAEIHAYLTSQQPHEIIVDSREVPIARREMSAAELVPKPRVVAPTLPMQQRLSSYAEVELGYSAEQAMAEAQRCLVCGPCSECMACVQVCKPGAVVHEQHETFANLDIGAIIYAGDPSQFEHLPLVEGKGLYRVIPESAIMGSAVAARAMFDLFDERQLWPALPGAGVPGGPPRVGVFVCRCGDQIGSLIDTEAVCEQASRWPDVVHTQVLPFSCSPEAAGTMQEAMAAHHLNRGVLAACSCCAIDQVCYSCTFQRVRCKTNLGVFGQPATDSKGNLPVAWEFVNIREQCAWAHADDPQAATAKATALVAASVAKVRALTPRPVPSCSVEHTALILGDGVAAQTCRGALNGQGIIARQVAGATLRIQRADGRYLVTQNDSTWQASALVLAPGDAQEAERLVAAFEGNGHLLQVQTAWGGLDSRRPGVFYCELALDPARSGAAAAARVAAWLGRVDGRAEPITAVVDPARCRACHTCVDVCEFGAPQLVGEDPQRTCWIDPIICTGCGTCAAHCPSGAITAGYSTDAQLELMLEQVVGGSWADSLQPATRNPQPKVIVFTCNWNAYSGLETAGAQHLSYATAVRPLKVMCLGRLSPGIILKAFEKGADGVLLLGCPPGECHYEFGNDHAKDVFAEAKGMAMLLGYRDEQLKLDWMAAGEGEILAEKVQAFVAGLNGDRG